jgi:DNA-binding beta-propeller fold protein YncE
LSPHVTCHSACHLNPFGLALHPAKAIAYVTNIGADSLSSYILAGDGTLAPLELPVPTGRHPFGVALDPQGKFLYVTNKIDRTVSGFAVHSNGKLSPLAGSPFRAGGGPSGIVIVTGQ